MSTELTVHGWHCIFKQCTLKPPNDRVAISKWFFKQAYWVWFSRIWTQIGVVINACGLHTQFYIVVAWNLLLAEHGVVCSGAVSVLRWGGTGEGHAGLFFSISVPLMLLVFWSHVWDPWRVSLYSLQCASHSDPKSNSLETQIWFCFCPVSVRFFYFSISLRSQTLCLPFGDNLYFSKYVSQNAYISSHNIKL